MGSEGNGDEAQIRAVLQDVVAAGSIASFVTSPVGFQFRRLGAGEHWGARSTPPTLNLNCGATGDSTGSCVPARLEPPIFCRLHCDT